MNRLASVGMVALVAVLASFGYWTFKKQPVRMPDQSQAVIQPADSSRSPVPMPMSEITAPYVPPSLTQLQRMAGKPVHGSSVMDVHMSLAVAESLCAYPLPMGTRTLVEASARGKLPRDDASNKSHALVDGFRGRFCDGNAPPNAEMPSTDPLLYLEEAAAAGSLEAKTLLDFAKLEEEGSELPATAPAALKEIVSRTTSPAMLQLSAEALGRTAAVGGLAGFDSSGIHPTDMELITQVGSHMAACKSFNLCDRQTHFSVRACMPSSCRGSATLNDHFRNSLTPIQLAAAQRFADAVLRGRL